MTEPDRYQEWIDWMLIKEHEEHPERFATVRRYKWDGEAYRPIEDSTHPSTPPPATPTTRGAEQKGVDGGG